MFTIEHEFDATIITLVDELRHGRRPLNEDVRILAFDDRVVVEQVGRDGSAVQIELSLEQLDELRAALDLPEGSYRVSALREAGR